MKKLLFLLFSFSSFAFAMQKWGDDEMTFLEERLQMQYQLIDHGLIKLWIANNPLSDIDIETIVGQLVVREKKWPGTEMRLVDRFDDKDTKVSHFYLDPSQRNRLKIPSTWNPNVTGRLREYLKSRIHCLSQLEFLSKLAYEIRRYQNAQEGMITFYVQGAYFKQFYLKELQGTADCDKQEQKVLPLICAEQKSLYKAYLLLPRPIKEIARQYVHLLDQ